MNDASPVVAKTANTPAQARLFVSLLEAEGIPAFVDGDSLTDEFAMSRKLMNLVSVRVMVPPSSLERAREILQPVAVDEQELARQAEAAAEPETPPVAPVKGQSRARVWPWLLLVLGSWAVVSWLR